MDNGEREIKLFLKIDIMLFILYSTVSGSMSERFRLFALHCWVPDFISQSFHMRFVVDILESGQFFFGGDFSHLPLLQINSTDFSILLI